MEINYFDNIKQRISISWVWSSPSFVLNH